MAYTASATSTGGRNGHVESSDGLIKLDLSIPKDLGGPGRPGTSNPEQLFAAGYAACLGSAIEFVASTDKVHIAKPEVTVQVTIDHNESGFFLAVKLHAKIEGVDHATAQALVEKAHQVCPYSKATRGNVNVELEAA